MTIYETENHAALHPWRRFFARTLDYDLYVLPLELLCLLVFRLNPSSVAGQFASSVCVFAAYLLMLFIEPVLLHFFGTTPGKWIFGLRITDGNGAFLSYEDGLQRTWNVIRRGEGFGVPFYSLYRNWKCYKLCIREEPCPWDEFPLQRLYTVRNTKIWRGILWFVSVSALVFVNQWAAGTAALPPNRGELTVAEYAENFNYLRDYYSTAPLGAEFTYTLAENGAWQWISAPDGEYVSAGDVPNRREPIPFEYFTDENGNLTGFSISNENGEYWELMDTEDFQYAALALIAAQPEVTPFSRTVQRLQNQIANSYLADTTFTEAGVTVSFTYTFSDESVSYRFTVTQNP